MTSDINTRLRLAFVLWTIYNIIAGYSTYCSPLLYLEGAVGICSAIYGSETGDCILCACVVAQYQGTEKPRFYFKVIINIITSLK